MGPKWAPRQRLSDGVPQACPADSGKHASQGGICIDLEMALFICLKGPPCCQRTPLNVRKHALLTQMCSSWGSSITLVHSCTLKTPCEEPELVMAFGCV